MGDPNKRHHIFANPHHNLDALVRHYGSEGDALRAIEDTVRQAQQDGKLGTDKHGVYKQVFDVGGYPVVVVGKMSMAWCASERLGFRPGHGAGRSSFRTSRERQGGSSIRDFRHRLEMEMTMPNLSPPEQQIIRSMLLEKFGSTSPLLNLVASLDFQLRHMTGTGYYVDFSNAKNLPSINKLNTELSDDFRTRLEPPQDLVGFTLFIRGGYLSSFEGYTFGDVPWPDDLMEEWLIFDAA